MQRQGVDMKYTYVQKRKKWMRGLGGREVIELLIN